MDTARARDVADFDTPGQGAPGLGRVEQQRVLLHMPVDVRSTALAVLAVLASVYVLRWASEVFIPLLLGIMFSYALSPLVNRMVRWHIPRALAAALLLGGLLSGAGTTVYALSDDASVLVETLPSAARKLSQFLRPEHGARPGTMETVQKAAAQLERAADENSPVTTRRGVTRVQIERPRFDIKDYLWTGTLGLIGLCGQTLIVCFITYFLITSGDSFRRKLVRLAGPTFTRRKITLQALNEINHQIQLYLLVQLGVSFGVGVATWLAFLWIGLDHAAVWGVVAGVLNLIPYIGSIAVTGVAAVVGLLQFGTLEMALLVGGVSLLIQTIEGYGISPWLTGRACRMSPVVIFVAVLAWGWLWGLWGLLLGVPIMMAIKTVCDRVDDLKALGELLGD